jgi:hypothetical protein
MTARPLVDLRQRTTAAATELCNSVEAWGFSPTKSGLPWSGALAPAALLNSLFRSCLLALVLLASAHAASAQAGPSGAPRPPAQTPKAAALLDLTGYWVSIIDDEWRWRMMTPAKGDFSFVPLNPEGRRVGGLWDPAKDEADGNQCRAFGAAGIMHLPERLHITWADERTLEIDADAGTQKRLLHFDGSKWTGGEPDWQGDSVASWEKQPQGLGFGIPPRVPPAQNAGSMKVVTTHMRPGYLRKNGVPYSGNAVLTEFFDRIQLDDQPYLVVTGVVEDPQYLTGRFITTEQFKLEPDASKWNPTPCKTARPTAPPVAPRPAGF